MDEVNKVVVRYLDGRVVKGTTEDFFPNRLFFHLHVHGSNEWVDVHCNELKAVFFVRDFAGNPQRASHAGFCKDATALNRGKKIAVRFKDGEFLCGYTLSYLPDRNGFFVSPADPTDNNLRVYVLAHATREVRLGPAADALARNAPRPQRPKAA